MKKILLQCLQDQQALMAQLKSIFPAIENAVHKMIASLQNGGKILWMGNGGSAADAQHLAAELVGRFKQERPALASIALTTNTSVLTCLSNDYDYSIVFSRQIEALCQPYDIVIGISTSGNSLNVIKGIRAAQKIGAYTIGFTGHDGGELSKIVDLNMAIPSNNTERIQEAHIFIGHCICELIEKFIFEDDETEAAPDVACE